MVLNEMSRQSNIQIANKLLERPQYCSYELDVVTTLWQTVTADPVD